MKLYIAIILAVVGCSGCRYSPPATEVPYESYFAREAREKAERDAPVPQLDLNAPSDASVEDIAATAKAMAARSESYGYKGVTAQVIRDESGPRIRLSCPTGITKEMRTVLRTMGAVSARRVEIRLHYNETQAEREQQLYTWEKKTTPPGAKWYLPYSVYDPEGVTRLGASIGGPRLLLDEPVLRAPDLQGPRVEDRFTSYEFVPPRSGIPNWQWGVFLVDGQIITESLRAYSGSKAMRVYVGDYDGPLGHCLKFPMPLRLEPTRSTTR